MNHQLKTWPTYFRAVMEGRKNFEIRDNTDRGFQAGDSVTLLEFDPKAPMNPAGEYTGRSMSFVIGYVTPFEQKPGFVVFSLVPRLPQTTRDTQT